MYRIIQLFLVLYVLANCSPKVEAPAQKISSPFAVSADKVRLRKSPSTSGEVISLLDKGEEIEILEYDKEKGISITEKDGMTRFGSWVRVRIPEKGEGYVFSNFIGYQLGKENSPSYIAVSPQGEIRKKGDRLSLPVMGISPSGVLENHSEYYNGSAKFAKPFPNKDLNVFDSSGREIGTLRNTQKVKGDDCCGEDLFVGGKFFPNSSESDSIKAVLARPVGSYRPSNPIAVANDVSDSVTKEIWMDTNRRIFASKRELPKDFRSVTCEKDCSYKRFRTKQGLEYLITEKKGNVDGHYSDVPVSPNVFRIDRIDSGKPVYIHLSFQFSYQGNKAKSFAVTDLDGDDLPEVWLYWEGYEWWYYSILILQGDWAIPVYAGGGGGV